MNEKNNKGKKKIVIILVIVLVIIAIGVVLFTMIRRNDEKNAVSLTVHKEKVEIEYGETYLPEKEFVSWHGGDLSIKNNIDFKKIGTYEIVYTVTSLNGYTETKSLPVIIKDTKKPEISTWVGDSIIAVNSEANILEGVSASDNYDGDLTNKIIVTGSVDTAKAGTYEIQYDVQDSSGNKADTRKRNYIVKAKPELNLGTYISDNGQKITLKEENKIIFERWNPDISENMQYMGTYDTYYDELSFTLTNYWNYVGWARIGGDGESHIFSITENNVIKDTDGNVYRKQ